MYQEYDLQSFYHSVIVSLILCVDLEMPDLFILRSRNYFPGPISRSVSISVAMALSHGLRPDHYIAWPAVGSASLEKVVRDWIVDLVGGHLSRVGYLHSSICSGFTFPSTASLPSSLYARSILGTFPSARFPFFVWWCVCASSWPDTNLSSVSSVSVS